MLKSDPCVPQYVTSFGDRALRVQSSQNEVSRSMTDALIRSGHADTDRRMLCEDEDRGEGWG